jgi:PadR family transcriptional regulator PadR
MPAKRLVPDVEHLGEFEILVLGATIAVRDDPYGVPIQQEVAQRASRYVSRGAVYATLQRLEDKGFVSSWVGDPAPERGGRAKRYYKVNEERLKPVLRNTHDRYRKLTGPLNEVIAALGESDCEASIKRIAPSATFDRRS